jgi:hypothetical protein
VTRRVALACAVFAVGVFAGIAVLRPGHHGPTPQERDARAAVAAASGGQVVQVACTTDHCGVVVRQPGAATCQGWVVPLRNGRLGVPRRSALVHC